MSWKDWPKWVKILGVISLVIIILLIIGTIKILLTPRKDFLSGLAMLMILMIMFWYFLTIVGLWALGFLTKHLIKKRLYWIANTISIIGLIVFSIWFLQILISEITPPYQFGIGTFIIFFGWSAIIIIYFIISLRLINKAKKIENIAVLEKETPTPFRRAVITVIIGLIFAVIFKFIMGRAFNISWFTLLILISSVCVIVGFTIGKIKQIQKGKKKVK